MNELLIIRCWLVSLFVLQCINPFFLVIQHQIKFQTIQFSISIVYVYKQLNVKTVLFQTTQLSISTQFSSIWPIDQTLSGAITPGQSGPESDGNEGVLCIPQSSSMTGISPTIVLYLGHLLEVSYPSAKKQPVYSTAPVDCAI